LMPDAVYRTLSLLCLLVEALPIGTNLGLLHLLWALVSGRLLTARGAVIAGLSDWRSGALLARWAAMLREEGRWQAHAHGGYRPVAVDVTGFWRPRLRDCPTTHYHGPAGRALPAIPLGIIARVGSVGAQRLACPLAFVRAD